MQEQYVEIMLFKELLNEAVYDGMLGIMEFVQFFKYATNEDKDKLKELVKLNKANEVWDLVSKVTGIDLSKLKKT